MSEAQAQPAFKPYCFEGNPNGSPRILILGHSLTLHLPKADIGWHGAWGMAASCKENDYAHRVIAGLSDVYPDAAYCIVSGSSWEVSYRNCDYERNFAAVRNFQPDVIYCCLCENIPMDTFEKEPFKENLHKLFVYLSGRDALSPVLLASSFYNVAVKNEALAEYADEHENCTLLPISDLVADESNLAVGLFEHPGVQHHPGDKGMQALADRIVPALKKILSAH